jgi:formylglycine-generating enzyme required for sulfatase activity
VKIKNPFYLGTYLVTQAEWEAVMGNNPSYFKGDDLPVEKVSWDDVQEFIKKLNETEGTDKYRLPSEAEWEYACRAGTTTRYSFGDSESQLGDYAWYAENSGLRPPKKGDFFGSDKNDLFSYDWKGKTHPVGQKKPNSWGLYDMHGNVWEWVQDKWHDRYNGAPTDGSAWDANGTYRVYRGGGWDRLTGSCRSAIRFSNVLGDRFNNLGFRLLKEL